MNVASNGNYQEQYYKAGHLIRITAKSVKTEKSKMTLREIFNFLMVKSEI